MKTVRTNAPISSAKLSAIMAMESLDNMPGNARRLDVIRAAYDQCTLLKGGLALGALEIVA